MSNDRAAHRAVRLTAWANGVEWMETDTGIVAGVGLTALMVAAARAMETHRADSLACDVFAERLVRAAPACADWPVRIEDAPGGDDNPLWGRLGRYFGVRTRVFDDYLLDATRSGARQIVLLGAGLDARGFRLPWPEGRTVFEVDRPEMMAFKHRVFYDLGSTPTANYRPIAADLCEPDWTELLLSAGFDPGQPSAWLAEGLFLYLPGDAERRVVEAVDRLTVGGSTFAFEVKLGVESHDVRTSPVYTATREQIGIDLLRLFDGDPRPDSITELARRGWSTTTTTPFEFSRLLGAGPLPVAHDALAANRWMFARRP